MAQTTLSVRPWRVDVAGRVWRVLSSVRVGLVLIFLVTLCTFIGTLVPQSSNAGLYDSVAYANWLNFQRERFGLFGSLVTLFDAAGIFNIFQAWYFRLLLVCLTVAVLCGGIINRIPRIWRGAMHLPPIQVGERLFEVHESARHVDGHGTTAQGQAALSEALRRRHYRVVAQDDGERAFVYADKNRFGIFGTFVSHIGLILVLLGALIGSTYGWRDDVFTITDGAVRPIGNNTDLAVRNELFVDEYDPQTGQPSDFYTDAVLLQQEGDGWAEVRRHRIRVNDPLSHDGVVVHQAFFGPAAVVTVKDNQGQVLYSDGVAMPWRNPDGRPLGWFDIPAGRFPIPLTVFVIGRVPGGPFADRGIKPGQVAVEVYPSGRSTPDTLLFRNVLDVGTPSVVQTPNGRTLLELTFERERQFTGLNVSYNPGLPLTWVACVLMLIGWSAVFYFPHRRLRAMIAPLSEGGARIASVVISRLDFGADREHEQVIRDVADTMANQTQPAEEQAAVGVGSADRAV